MAEVDGLELLFEAYNARHGTGSLQKQPLRLEPVKPCDHRIPCKTLLVCAHRLGGDLGLLVYIEQNALEWIFAGCPAGLL